MTTTLDQREAKNQLLAEQARQRIDGDPRRLVLFLGTGVSYGMTKQGTSGNRLCSWTPFLEELASKLPGDCAERAAFDKILGDSSPDSTSVILGLAHMIREKLVSVGTWAATIQDIAEEIHEAYDPTSEWSRFFRAMRDRSADRGNGRNFEIRGAGGAGDGGG
ncbi:MAG: hypothetical protein ACI9R3_006302 [Verrucomicrobiales bacterium]|jgi:hypothetical protein